MSSCCAGCITCQNLCSAHPINAHTAMLVQVQKSARHYTEAAYDEIKLLTEIREGDPGQSQNCVQLRDSFEHSGPHGTHVCMVFEVISPSLALTAANTCCCLSSDVPLHRLQPCSSCADVCQIQAAGLHRPAVTQSTSFRSSADACAGAWRQPAGPHQGLQLQGHPHALAQTPHPPGLVSLAAAIHAPNRCCTA